jgi:hypothetical protein
MLKFKNFIFIDSPGINSNESQEEDKEVYRIIADYLRRKDISEFKLIYLIS